MLIRPSLLCAALALFMAADASAQVALPPVSPARALLIPDGAVAGEADATSLETNPGQLGFVEGARVEVLHEGIVGRDPIAVRVENVTIAVRRREAMAVIVA